MRRWARSLAPLALAACTHRTTLTPQVELGTAGPGTTTAVTADAEQANTVAAAFLAEEALGSPSADTLLAGGADFVMTGVTVTTRPRLAGLNGPGRTEIEEANLSLSGAFAWVVMTYRFIGREPELSERAHATVILEKQRAGWKIRHVHSSMVARW